MPRDYSYTWEKMFNALTTLTEHPGRIQERVLEAVMSAHTVLSGRTDDFPPDARPYVAAIMERMTAEKDPSAGHFEASARAMSDDEAVQVATWLREVYFRIHKLSDADDVEGGELDPPS